MCGGDDCSRRNECETTTCTVCYSPVADESGSRRSHEPWLGLKPYVSPRKIVFGHTVRSNRASWHNPCDSSIFRDRRSRETTDRVDHVLKSNLATHAGETERKKRRTNGISSIVTVTTAVTQICDEGLRAVHGGGFIRRKPQTIPSSLSLESARTLVQRSLDIYVNSRLVFNILRVSTCLLLFVNRYFCSRWP